MKLQASRSKTMSSPSTSTSPYWLTGSPIQASCDKPATRSLTSGHTMTRRPLRRPVTIASDFASPSAPRK